MRGASCAIIEALKGWNESELGKRFFQLGTEFAFMAPKSSHALGSTERCVRLMRRHLRHVLDQQVLGEEAFHTVVVECESIVNSRPLVAATSDESDYRSLTPNDLLLLRPDPGLPPRIFPAEPANVRLRRQWHQVQILANSFWKRFRADYLQTLHARQKWLVPRTNFAVDDLVLMHEANAPRNTWKLARITKTYPSQDGQVRSVQVRTSNGHLFDRPVQKLYMLESSS